jgi:hypothetical protein
MCAQAGGTREGISIFCLSISLPPTNAHAFKIGTLGFQDVTLAKRQQDSLLFEFSYGFNKAFGIVLFFMIISAPSLKLILNGLIHSTFSMFTRIAGYYQFH